MILKGDRNRLGPATNVLPRAAKRLIEPFGSLAQGKSPKEGGTETTHLLKQEPLLGKL
jgi:hypothetical protein